MKRALAATALVLSLFLGARAYALPIYAAREGVSCIHCHVDPTGGGIRNTSGFIYETNRHAWTEDARWKDIAPKQKVTESLTFGTDLRLLWYYFRQDSTGQNLNSFLDMKGALNASFTPTEHITLVVSEDVANDGNMKPRDVYAMYMLKGGMYIRSGLIRPPYGLRLENHSAYIRGGASLTPTPDAEDGILDFDARRPDAGIEVGCTTDKHFIHLAVQNGSEGPGPEIDTEKTVTAKAGIVRKHVMLGGSVRHNPSLGFDPFERKIRYGGFGSLSGGKCVLLADVDFSSDRMRGAPKQEAYALFTEANYEVSRDILLKARFEQFDPDRHNQAGNMPPILTVDRTTVIRRATAGVFLQPIPFGRLELEYRRTMREAPQLDENWVLVQSYWAF